MRGWVQTPQKYLPDFCDIFIILCCPKWHNSIFWNLLINKVFITTSIIFKIFVGIIFKIFIRIQFWINRLRNFYNYHLMGRCCQIVWYQRRSRIDQSIGPQRSRRNPISVLKQQCYTKIIKFIKSKENLLWCKRIHVIIIKQIQTLTRWIFFSFSPFDIFPKNAIK